MQPHHSPTKMFIMPLLFVTALLAGIYFVPWEKITWGKLEFLPASTVTVNGEAKDEQRNQIATFTAGVSVVHDDKQSAMNEVNDKIGTLIQAIKTFGTNDQDIKTQNLTVYQREETYWDNDRQKTRKGQWYVSNSVQIKLRDVDQASDLADVLGKSGANSISGPNFQLDDTTETEKDLLSKAIEDAREKGEIMALAEGRTLGKVISISEGGAVSGALRFPMGFEGGGGIPVEPGSGTVYKTVSVVFELK